MSRSSAKLEIGAGSLADAIAASIEGECAAGGRGAAPGVRSEGGTVSVEFPPQEIPHLRASLNSTLRLIQAGHDTLEATR